ncbi:MAG: thioredoxin family protein [Clostridium sp.]|uniref:thioredoxin family protein n=1 Tax=Clostridium sp. DSM 8431 TaxID=1761781 RepID=UPI0008EDB6F5|nr:thioredoxin family protein [Clostridium sp. DSM 8431]MCR4944516.1 thioredoxin family protein [Clostridium sp.]SFU87140.1 Thioredoxin [Clostridium sp. DSM 8431]
MEESRVDYVNNKIASSEMLILYFSNESCGACEVIRNKVDNILKSYPKIEIIDINGEKERELAASKYVLTFPLLILYVQGKETIRVGRNVDLLELEKSIRRYYEIVF